MTQKSDEEKGSESPPTVRADRRAIAVGGSVSGSILRTGDEVHIRGEIDLERFRALLEALRRDAKNAGLDPEEADAILGELVEVEAEAEKEKPNKTRILGKLKTVGEIASSAATVGEKLVPATRLLGEVAARLF